MCSDDEIYGVVRIFNELYRGSTSLVSLEKSSAMNAAESRLIALSNQKFSYHFLSPNIYLLEQTSGRVHHWVLLNAY